MSPPDDEDDDFFGESTTPTVVDAVVELAAETVTRKTVGMCGWCGGAGCLPRGKCRWCGLIPQAGHELCLGCEGETLFLSMLAAAPTPRNYDEAARLSAAGDGVRRCISCPTWWCCVVMHELEA